VKHIIFQQGASYPVALLIKPSYLRQYELERHYLDRISPDIHADQVIAFDVDYGGKKKASNATAKAYLQVLLPELQDVGVQFIYCADAEYFKVLTGQTKADAHYGYSLPCKIKGFEHIQVILGMNYGQLVYNPELYSRLDITLEALVSTFNGTYQAPGTGIIRYSHYPQASNEIAAALESLHQYSELSADIETFSLAPYSAGVGSVGFAWGHHEGIAFPCDYRPLPMPQEGFYGEQVDNPKVRYHLKRFFETYQGRLRWHNATFDIRSIVATLWMRNPLDYKGMVEGLHVMCRLFDDTKIIAYLALNTTAEVGYSLKELAHEFAGNYAQDAIKDIRRIPLPQLLEYNLVDCLATNYVFDKYYPAMVKDQQESLYKDLMLPSLKVIAQMELTGMPLDRESVARARKVLEDEVYVHNTVLRKAPCITTLEARLTQEAWEQDYQERVAKAVNPDKIKYKDWTTFPGHVFNPGSGQQLQKLLYEDLGLPVLDLTKTKQPATGGDTLKKLIHHTTDSRIKDLLDALIGLNGVSKILSDFIPKFEAAIDKGDSTSYLLGSFNLGGTVSGRLSSSKPNLQNLPSGSLYGKLIKACFIAPPGWLMVGADFNSLEDYISALTTKDPNKLSVYLENFDGHCLKAFSYFPERLPGIQNTVESINSIKRRFPDVRQDSKGPTFALTYQGTWITLVRNLGFSEAKAKEIEKAYHALYRVSDKWVQNKLDQAAKDGYVEVAFGLRVRTPLLSQTLRGHRTTPFQADAEGRTAGNALGQSYGLLNNRAANAFMKKVWASKYAHDILPIAQIHDASYYLIRDSVSVVEFVNNALIKEMQWQELPELQHDIVKLGAEMDVFWPSWATPITLPNNASTDAIRELCEERIKE
jgi:DNA polymerase-1